MVSDMKRVYDGIDIHVEVRGRDYCRSKPSLLLLHGFSGSSADWIPLLNRLGEHYSVIAPDLPGFGQSDMPAKEKYYGESFLSGLIDFLIDYFKLQHPVLCGYSMGGRIALAYAARNWQKLAGLILESTTAGIEHTDERKQRRDSDNSLADLIRKEGIEAFVERWLSLELFQPLQSLDGDVLRQYKERKLKNSPEGLIQSLNGFGTGSMKPVWNKLAGIDIPALIIAGSYDAKYSALAERLHSEIPQSDLKIVGNCGHVVHLEKEEIFINLVENFLQTLTSFGGNE